MDHLLTICAMPANRVGAVVVVVDSIVRVIVLHLVFVTILIVTAVSIILVVLVRHIVAIGAIFDPKR